MGYSKFASNDKADFQPMEECAFMNSRLGYLWDDAHCNMNLRHMCATTSITRTDPTTCARPRFGSSRRPTARNFEDNTQGDTTSEEGSNLSEDVNLSSEIDNDTSDPAFDFPSQSGSDLYSDFDASVLLKPDNDINSDSDSDASVLSNHKPDPNLIQTPTKNSDPDPNVNLFANSESNPNSLHAKAYSDKKPHSDQQGKRGAEKSPDDPTYQYKLFGSVGSGAVLTMIVIIAVGIMFYRRRARQRVVKEVICMSNEPSIVE